MIKKGCMINLGIFIVAMIALVYGADFVVNQSEKIAKHFGISDFINRNSAAEA